MGNESLINSNYHWLIADLSWCESDFEVVLVHGVRSCLRARYICSQSSSAGLGGGDKQNHTVQNTHAGPTLGQWFTNHSEVSQALKQHWNNVSYFQGSSNLGLYFAFLFWHISSPWIWKGVSATLWSGRYTLSYPRRRIICSPVA